MKEQTYIVLGIIPVVPAERASLYRSGNNTVVTFQTTNQDISEEEVPRNPNQASAIGCTSSKF